MVAAQENGDPTPLYYVCDAVYHDFGGLPGVRGVDVEVADVAQGRGGHGLSPDSRLHVHKGVLGGDLVGAAVQHGGFADAPGAIPGPGPRRHYSLVYRHARHHQHPLFHVLDAHDLAAEEGGEPLVRRIQLASHPLTSGKSGYVRSFVRG